MAATDAARPRTAPTIPATGPVTPVPAAEAGRLVDATYRVIERTGRVDPTVREILREAGLSTQAFYRHFASKDALLVVLLEDGRRQLTDYLARRMSAAGTPLDRIRTWIEGVLAQAADPAAADRTRPFLINAERLAERFPRQQQASIDALVRPLRQAVADAGVSNPDSGAQHVYRLAISAMYDFVRRREIPAAGDTGDLVRFCLRGLGLAQPATPAERSG